MSVSVIISATASIFRSRIWKETQSCGEKAQILLHQKIVHIFFSLKVHSGQNPRCTAELLFLLYSSRGQQSLPISHCAANSVYRKRKDVYFLLLLLKGEQPGFILFLNFALDISNMLTSCSTDASSVLLIDKRSCQSACDKNK